jgi:hypothetical protein
MITSSASFRRAERRAERIVGFLGDHGVSIEGEKLSDSDAAGKRAVRRLWRCDDFQNWLRDQHGKA